MAPSGEDGGETHGILILIPVVVLADLVLLLPKLKVSAAALPDLVLDDHDKGNLLLSLRVRELDDGRGDYDVVDIVLVVPVVPIIPAIATIAPVVTIVVAVIVASNHDHSSGIQGLDVARM